MHLNALCKSVLDADSQPIVLCDMQHTVVYMNPAAVRRYAKRGGAALVGTNIMDCHAPASREKILQVVDWFAQSPENNDVFTFHSDKENSDVYMIALRNEAGELIGYYEKHESRVPETRRAYEELAEN
ncbi:MAG: PAS domain-containing protein [Oscillospiraceae bacterium]|nr:PAS domain-containing protein [Oscillospiraceae bacterium]